jgi:hypothetical protein
MGRLIGLVSIGDLVKIEIAEIEMASATRDAQASFTLSPARRPLTATWAKSKSPTLILPIDQAEELFQAEGAEESLAFLGLLRELAVGDDPALIVLLAIRSDSYERLQSAEAVQGLRQHTLSLPAMPKGSYAEVIKGPARRLEGTKRARRSRSLWSTRCSPTSSRAALLTPYRTFEVRRPSALRQSVSDDVVSGRGSHEVMPASHDDEILPAADLIDHRIGLTAGRQEVLP